MSDAMSGRSADQVLDEYLVVRSQLGDAEAFGRLVRRWHGRLLRQAGLYTGDGEPAKDVVQESWIAIVRGLGSLQDPARFRAWAFRIVANKARDWVRREDARRRAAGRLAAEPTPDLPTSGSVRVERVRAGLAELEPAQRCVLDWFYLEGMSVAEMAEALDVPPGTVKSRLFYARRALAERLKER